MPSFAPLKAESGTSLKMCEPEIIFAGRHIIELKNSEDFLLLSFIFLTNLRVELPEFTIVRETLRLQD